MFTWHENHNAHDAFILWFPLPYFVFPSALSFFSFCLVVSGCIVWSGKAGQRSPDVKSSGTNLQIHVCYKCLILWSPQDVSYRCHFVLILYLWFSLALRIDLLGMWLYILSLMIMLKNSLVQFCFPLSSTEYMSNLQAFCVSKPNCSCKKKNKKKSVCL